MILALTITRISIAPKAVATAIHYHNLKQKNSCYAPTCMKEPSKSKACQELNLNLNLVSLIIPVCAL